MATSRRSRFSGWKGPRARQPNDAPARLPGLHYDSGFISPAVRAEIVAWLRTVFPLWEQRYSLLRPPPAGRDAAPAAAAGVLAGQLAVRLPRLLPAPDRGARSLRGGRAVSAGARAAGGEHRGADPRHVHGPDLPHGWHLNTCLVNFYGSRLVDGAWVDTARVGEHKDFEPGPVASLSLGERALFQFVTSHRPGERERVVAQQWLDDGSLQIFGGHKWKRQTFHRVQRVDDRDGHRFVFPVRGLRDAPRQLHLPLRPRRARAAARGAQPRGAGRRAAVRRDAGAALPVLSRGAGGGRRGEGALTFGRPR